MEITKCHKLIAVQIREIRSTPTVAYDVGVIVGTIVTVQQTVVIDEYIVIYTVDAGCTAAAVCSAAINAITIAEE